MDNKEIALTAGASALPLLSGDLGAMAYKSGIPLLGRDLPKEHSVEALKRLRNILRVPEEMVPVLHDLTRYKGGPQSSALFYGLSGYPEDTAKYFRDRDILNPETGKRFRPGANVFSPSDLAKKQPRGAVLLRHTKDVATLAHELGHATALNRGLIGKLRSVSDNISRRLTGGAMFPVRYGAALSPIFMDPDNPYLYAPAAAMAAAEAPLLLEEATASTKAISALKKMQGDPRVTPGSLTKSQYAAAKKLLGRMFASYALPAAGFIGAPLALAALKD